MRARGSEESKLEVCISVVSGSTVNGNSHDSCLSSSTTGSLHNLETFEAEETTAKVKRAVFAFGH